jgi:DNA repair protein RadC
MTKSKLKMEQECRIREAVLVYRKTNIISDNQSVINTEVQDPGRIHEIAKSIIANDGRENLLIFFMNSVNSIKAVSRAFIGTIDQAVVYPREVVRYCILSDTSRVIIVHNHPSGRVVPSSHDIEITSKIKQAAAAVDIELLDHMIITNDEYYSFRENGQL